MLPVSVIESPIIDRVVMDVTSTGDHDRFAHIVYPGGKVAEAQVSGSPVVALCGKVWRPRHKPEDHAVCKTCIEVFERETGMAWLGRR